METISANIKERILQVAKNKGISYEKFFKELGFSYGNFRGKSKNTAVGSNVLAEIIAKYPDVDLYWLVMGNSKGTEIPTTVETKSVFGKATEEVTDYKEKYLSLLEENRELNKKIIGLIED